MGDDEHAAYDRQKPGLLLTSYMPNLREGGSSDWTRRTKSFYRVRG